MSETITGKTDSPVTIENVEQASTNFYWTYETKAGSFNLQTTIRGVLDYERIKAHITSASAALAYIQELGGLAKQVGRSAYETPAVPLPTPTPVESVIATVVANDPMWNPPEVAPQESASSTPANPATEDKFETKRLVVSISNNKKYFRIKGGRWMPYGVKVWDEVLVPALAQLNRTTANLEGQEYDFVGFIATCSMKPDGKPDKVIKLDKVA